MTNPIIPDSFGLDRALAAGFFHARAGETVSLRAALAQQAGKPWGCRLCRLLDLVVERDHCLNTLSVDVPTVQRAAIRAGVALWLGVFVPTTIACWAFWAGVFWLGRTVL